MIDGRRTGDVRSYNVPLRATRWLPDRRTVDEDSADSGRRPVFVRYSGRPAQHGCLLGYCLLIGLFWRDRGRRPTRFGLVRARPSVCLSPATTTAAAAAEIIAASSNRHNNIHGNAFDPILCAANCRDAGRPAGLASASCEVRSTEAAARSTCPSARRRPVSPANSRRAARDYILTRELSDLLAAVDWPQRPASSCDDGCRAFWTSSPRRNNSSSSSLTSTTVTAAVSAQLRPTTSRRCSLLSVRPSASFSRSHARQ